MQSSNQPVELTVHIDPRCPLAWRTALWLREVQKTRPVTIHWKAFSLEIANRPEGVTPDYLSGGWMALRALMYLRRVRGDEAFAKLYYELGHSHHFTFDDIREQKNVAACLEAAGFPADLLETVLSDKQTITEVEQDHQEAKDRYLAFGVPTLALEGSHVGYYGPIIHTVPTGQEAEELWDYTYWALRNDNLFELKRDRGGVDWPPVPNK